MLIWRWPRMIDLWICCHLEFALISTETDGAAKDDTHPSNTYDLTLHDTLLASSGDECPTLTSGQRLSVCQQVCNKIIYHHCISTPLSEIYNPGYTHWFSFTHQRNHCLTIKYTNKVRKCGQNVRDKGEIFGAERATC